MPQTVSVIIPCYNGGNTIARAVDSLQKQTYSHIEIIVVDDHSDVPLEHSNLKRYTTHSLKLLRNEANMGSNQSINRGINAATGAYLTILAADDELPPNSIGDRIDKLQKGNDLVFGATKRIHNETETIIHNINPSRASVVTWIRQKNDARGINNATAMFTRQLREKVGYRLPRDSRGSHEDYEYALRLILHANKPTAVEAICYHYYLSEGGMMHNEMMKNKQAWLSAQTELENEYLIAFQKVLSSKK